MHMDVRAGTTENGRTHIAMLTVFKRVPRCNYCIAMHLWMHGPASHAQCMAIAANKLIALRRAGAVTFKCV